MKRSEYSKILIQGRPSLLSSMANEIEESYKITIENGPEKSLVMLKNQNTVTKHLFYSGELLVTECTVSVNEHRGLGVIIGDKPESAYYLAVIDAAFNAKLPESMKWEADLLLEQENIKDKHLKEAALIAQTKVNFDTMGD